MDVVGKKENIYNDFAHTYNQSVSDKCFLQSRNTSDKLIVVIL